METVIDTSLVPEAATSTLEGAELMIVEPLESSSGLVQGLEVESTSASVAQIELQERLASFNYGMTEHCPVMEASEFLVTISQQVERMNELNLSQGACDCDRSSIGMPDLVLHSLLHFGVVEPRGGFRKFLRLWIRRNVALFQRTMFDHLDHSLEAEPLEVQLVQGVHSGVALPWQ
jgi:hypothetical protein